jgi:hypothetical protein
MKNKFLIGTVAFVAVLAAIGILAVSFTMTPVLATNVTNGTQNITIGCTVAISMPDSTSSGGSGAETQEAYDNNYSAVVYADEVNDTGNVTNQYWLNGVGSNAPQNDYMYIRNVGNSYLQIDANLLSDNGLANPAKSFTGTENGKFAIAAYNGWVYGLDTNDGSCEGNGSAVTFQEMTLNTPVKICSDLDWLDNQNTLAINDRWEFKKVTPDTYNFLIQITATEDVANCGLDSPDPTPSEANLFVTYKAGATGYIESAKYDGTYLRTLATAQVQLLGTGFPVGGFADVGAPLYEISAAPYWYNDFIAVPGISTAGGPDATKLFFVMYEPDYTNPNTFKSTQGTVIDLSGFGAWHAGDAVVGVTSDSLSYGKAATPGAGTVFILATRGGAAGSYDVYSFASLIYLFNQAPPNPSGSLTLLETIAPAVNTIPTGSTVQGFAFVDVTHLGISYRDASNQPHSAQFLMSGGTRTSDYTAQLALNGLGTANGGATFVAASGSNNNNVNFVDASLHNLGAGNFYWVNAITTLNKNDQAQGADIQAPVPVE